MGTRRSSTSPPTEGSLRPHDVLGFVEGQPARHPARLTVAAQAVLEGSLVGIARASGAWARSFVLDPVTAGA
jgi:hypothetical protein